VVITDCPFSAGQVDTTDLVTAGMLVREAEDLRAAIGEIRAEMVSLMRSEECDMDEIDGTKASAAVALGIVPKSIASTLAIYGQCAFGGGTHLVAERASEQCVTMRQPSDKVPPLVKTAIMAATVAAAKYAIGVSSIGGQFGTIGVSIVGDTTFPTPRVSWVMRTAAYLDTNHHPGAAETAMSHNGQLGIKARTTNVEPDRRYAVYRKNKSYANVTSRNTKLRAFGGTALVATSGSTRTIPGVLSHDHRSAAKMTSASVMKSAGKEVPFADSLKLALHLSGLGDYVNPQGNVSKGDNRPTTGTLQPPAVTQNRHRSH